MWCIYSWKDWQFIVWVAKFLSKLRSCYCQEQRYIDNMWLRNVEVASWLWTDVVSLRYLAIMVILVMHIISWWTFIFILSGLPSHPEEVNNPGNITLIWYGQRANDMQVKQRMWWIQTLRLSGSLYFVKWHLVQDLMHFSVFYINLWRLLYSLMI